MTEYQKKLTDPRWQKKRLEIFERDEWQCQECKSTEKTLIVHHLKYQNGRQPWEYENKYLVTLCKMCHDHKHKKSQQFIKIEHDLIEGAVFKGINHSAVRAYLLIKSKFTGWNNDDLSFTYNEARHFMSSSTYSKAITQLVSVGLIDIVRSGTLQKCNIFALSERWRCYDTDLFIKA